MRVIHAIDQGLSTRKAAARFKVSVAVAGEWYRRWRDHGETGPRRQGQPPGSKLDAHEDFILELVVEAPDIALYEIAERLADDRGVSACPATIWHFFDKRNITYKKRQRMPQSSSART
jgi:transposase